MKVERIKSSRRRRLTETWSPGRRWRAGASTPSPARDGPAAAWTERNSCRRGWVRETACGSSARSAAESTADTAPRSTRSRSAGSGSAAACGRGTAREKKTTTSTSDQPSFTKPVTLEHKTRHTGHFYDIEINKWAFRWCMVWMIFDNLESEGAKTSEYWENQVLSNAYY